MQSIIQDGSDDRPSTIGGGNTYYTRRQRDDKTCKTDKGIKR